LIAPTDSCVPPGCQLDLLTISPVGLAVMLGERLHFVMHPAKPDGGYRRRVNRIRIVA